MDKCSEHHYRGVIICEDCETVINGRDVERMQSELKVLRKVAKQARYWQDCVRQQNPHHILSYAYQWLGEALYKYLMWQVKNGG